LIYELDKSLEYYLKAKEIFEKELIESEEEV